MTGQQTGNGSLGPVTPFTPTVAPVDADTIALTFSPALPDQSCYTIEVLPAALAENLGGDRTLMVRALVGDATASGDITLSDAILIAVQPGGPALAAPQFDLDLSGTIDFADALAAKGLVASPAASALCP